MRSLLCLLTALLILAGCGGGGGGSSPSSSPVTSPNVGQAAVSVVWPSRTRGLPVAANSVVLDVLQSGAVLQSQTVARPADGASSVASFANLPLQTLGVRMSAYASTDGSGTPLAVGTSTLTTTEGTPTPITMTTNPIVASLALSATASSVPQNGTLSLAVTATDAMGAMLPDSAQGVRWTSDAPSIATVTGPGASATVTGVAVGSTTIRATLVRADNTTVSAEAVVTVSATGGTVTIH